MKNMKHRIVYSQTNFPIFQNYMYKTAEEARNCPTGDILLIENADTGLIYNTSFDPTLLHYDLFYQNDQSCSPTFQKHMENVANLISTNMGCTKLIEIGCGKGKFLEFLQARGVEIIGFDPAYEGKNPNVKREYFNGKQKLKGNGIILRHVLEHISEPVEFLKALAEANDGAGLVYIEVPCFDWICRNNAWFDIFYEHVNYFRLSDFSKIFNNLIYMGHTFSGQYISIIADLASLCEPKRNPKQFTDFSIGLDKNLRLLKNSKINQEIIVWGAGSKGVIFSLLLEREGVKVERIIDINPDKQGKYIPGTGLKVMSPTEGLKDLTVGSEIYVMNPNYLSEVRSMVGPNFFCKGTRDDQL